MIKWAALAARARFSATIPAAALSSQLTVYDLQVNLCEWRKFRTSCDKRRVARRGACCEPEGGGGGPESAAHVQQLRMQMQMGMDSFDAGAAAAAAAAFLPMPQSYAHLPPARGPDPDLVALWGGGGGGGGPPGG